MGSNRLQVIACVLLGFVAGAGVASVWRSRSQQPTESSSEESALVAAESESRPGWFWAMPPGRTRGSSNFATGVASFEKDASGATALLVALERGPNTEEEVRYEAVLLDSTDARVRTVRYPRRSEGGSIAMYRFGLGELEPAVAAAGVERATTAGLRALSVEARRRADSSGVHTLPFPEVGEAFPFDLDLREGGVVRSADYQGKVVVIDCWASWCPPCMVDRSKLSEIYATYRDRGVEIVSVSFDFLPSEGEEAFRKHGGTWKCVFAGVDPSTLDLWHDTTTLQGVPRMFLIDRKGILRWDRRGADMEGLTAELEKVLSSS